MANIGDIVRVPINQVNSLVNTGGTEEKVSNKTLYLNHVVTAVDGTDIVAVSPQYASGGGGGVGNVAITDPIGQDLMANSVAVAIASDQSTIPTSPGIATTDAVIDRTLNSGSLTTTPTLLMAANTARIDLFIQNKTGAEIMVYFGGSASANRRVILANNGIIETSIGSIVYTDSVFVSSLTGSIALNTALTDNQILAHEVSNT